MAHATHAGPGPAYSRHYPQERTVDPQRITAITAAIVLHAAVLMALLMPASLPPMPDTAPHEIVVDIPLKRIEVPPVPVEVEQTPRPMPPDPVRQPVRTPLVEPPGAPVASAEPGDLPALPEIPAIDPGPATMPDLSPMTGARLAYASAPPPEYPARAVREARTGTVLLEVVVDVDGTPIEVAIMRSSGHRDLDRAALDQVLKHWRFHPASRDGHPVRAVGLVPVEFKL